MFWTFPVLINCSCDLKNLANSWPSASNFKSFSQSQEHFFLTLGQNNFGNKIPLLHFDNFFPNCLCENSILTIEYNFPKKAKARIMNWSFQQYFDFTYVCSKSVITEIYFGKAKAMGGHNLPPLVEIGFTSLKIQLRQLPCLSYHWLYPCVRKKKRRQQLKACE